MNGKHSGRTLAAVLLGTAVLFFCGFAAADEARNIAAECSYRTSQDSGRNIGSLYDGSYSHPWQSAGTPGPGLEVTLPDGETCSGVQIKWQALNTGWYIEAEENGEWVRAGEADGYLNSWTPLPDVTKFRLCADPENPKALKIAEMEV